MAKRGGADEDRRARGEQTRLDLIEAGRELFVERGFFNTSIGDLVTKSGVGTRGAFYHHFKDKAELFRAVFEDVENDLTLRSIAAPRREPTRGSDSRAACTDFSKRHRNPQYSG